jgi:hypothetical protein
MCSHCALLALAGSRTAAGRTGLLASAPPARRASASARAAPRRPPALALSGTTTQARRRHSRAAPAFAGPCRCLSPDALRARSLRLRAWPQRRGAAAHRRGAAARDLRAGLATAAAPCSTAAARAGRVPAQVPGVARSGLESCSALLARCRRSWRCFGSGSVRSCAERWRRRWGGRRRRLSSGAPRLRGERCTTRRARRRPAPRRPAPGRSLSFSAPSLRTARW